MGKDVARVHSGLRPLQCDKRSDQHTRAGQQHERRGDLCYDEDALSAAGAAGYANAAA